MSQRCTDCHRTYAHSRRSCLYCGGELRPTKDVRELHCPSCAAPMQKVDARGTVVDVCSSCRGQFYDLGELNQLLEPVRRETSKTVNEPAVTRRPTPRTPDTHGHRNCPVCNRIMQRHNFGRVSGIIMDRCLHGVFLDSGELRKIKEFIIAGGEHGVASVKTAPKDHSSSQHRIRMNADLTHSTTGEVIAVLISEALSAMDVL